MKSRARKPKYRIRGAESGNAVIEFALILPLLLLVVFGITEFGRALMTVNVLTSAAREGARVASVAGADSVAVAARVMQVLDAANITPAEGGIIVSGPDANRAITVTVESDFEILSAKILPVQGIIRLRGSAVMRFEG
jgi:Flp pilus assembly protein TadG